MFFQNKKEETLLKRRNVPLPDSTDSEDNEKPTQQSLETIVQNAHSSEPSVQLSAVQAARFVDLLVEQLDYIYLIISDYFIKISL